VRGGKTEEWKNPLKQARGDYLNGVLEKIKVDGRLVSRNPADHS